MQSLSETVTKCGDYSAEDSWCSRGMPVAPLFGHYFCNGKHDRCPLRLWVKSLPEPANVVRPRKPSIMRRKA